VSNGDMLRSILNRTPIHHAGALLGSIEEGRTLMEAIAWGLLRLDCGYYVRTPAGDCVLRELEGLRGSA